MINLIGFDGPEPHSVIFWRVNGDNHAKTICYSLEEEQTALERLNTAGDYYNQFDQAVVIDNNETLRSEYNANRVYGRTYDYAISV
jgi:hypothetical protein